MCGPAPTLMRWPATIRGLLYGLHVQPSLLWMTRVTLWVYGIPAGPSPRSCAWWMYIFLQTLSPGSSVICAPGVFPDHGASLHAPPIALSAHPRVHLGHLHHAHALLGPAISLPRTPLLPPTHLRDVGCGRQSPTTVCPQDLSGHCRLFGDLRTTTHDWTYLRVHQATWAQAGIRPPTG